MNKGILLLNSSDKKVIVNVDLLQNAELVQDRDDPKNARLYLHFGNEQVVAVKSGVETMRVWNMLLEFSQIVAARGGMIEKGNSA
jgi:hypothetical protein